MQKLHLVLKTSFSNGSSLGFTTESLVSGIHNVDCQAQFKVHDIGPGYLQDCLPQIGFACLIVRSNRAV